MAAIRVEVFAPLTPAECVELLTAAMDSDNAFSLKSIFGARLAVGRVTEMSLRVRKRHPDRRTVPFLLYARLRPIEGGTLISGTMHMHPVLAILMAIWLTFFATVSVVLVVAMIVSLLENPASRGSASWFDFLFVGTIISVFAGLAWLTHRQAHDDAAYLTSFLEETLDGHSVLSSSRSASAT